jgi:hypothetical protein
MSTFTIPESVFVYYNDKAVMAAVDHLLGEKKESLPGVDDWSDLPAYYRARLSAYQCQADHALMLFDLWNAIWQPAIDAEPCLAGATRVSLADYPGEYGQALDVGGMWLERGIGSAFTLPSGFLMDANVYCTPGIVIGCAVWNEAGKIDTDTLDIGNALSASKQEATPLGYEFGYRYTPSKSVPLTSQKIDLTPLKSTAATVIAAVAGKAT